MRNYKIFKVSNAWSTAKLTRDVETKLNQLEMQGYEIISVSFGYNNWYIATAFITARKAL